MFGLFNAFARPIFKNLLLDNTRLYIPCNREMAKEISASRESFTLCLRLHTIDAVAEMVLWRDDVREAFLPPV